MEKENKRKQYDNEQPLSAEGFQYAYGFFVIVPKKGKTHFIISPFIF